MILRVDFFEVMWKNIQLQETDPLFCSGDSDLAHHGHLLYY